MAVSLRNKVNYADDKNARPATIEAAQWLKFNGNFGYPKIEFWISKIGISVITYYYFRYRKFKLNSGYLELESCLSRIRILDIRNCVVMLDIGISNSGYPELKFRIIIISISEKVSGSGISIGL
jgi:hypothetical protein